MALSASSGAFTQSSLVTGTVGNDAGSIVAHPDYEAAVASGPDVDDALFLASSLLETSPKDSPGTDLNCAVPPRGQARQSTKVWFTVYADRQFVDERNELSEASDFTNYLRSKINGGTGAHGVGKPNIGICLDAVRTVPSSINNGDVVTDAHLRQLLAHDALQAKPGRFVVVLGWDKIEHGGTSNHGITEPQDADATLSNLNKRAIAYFHYPYSSAYAGFRVGVHEVGHVFGLQHSSCNSETNANHDWYHLMALTSDPGPGCDFWTDDVHWFFKGPDASQMENEFIAWCNAWNNGGGCPA